MVTWWIVAGVVVLAVLVFVSVLAALLGRLRPLRRAARRVGLRAEQVQRLATKIAVVQERVLLVQGGLEEATAGADRLRGAQAAPDGEVFSVRHRT